KKNFVTWVIDSLRSGKGLPLFDDQLASPTFAPHCARVLLKLLERGSRGVYHTSGPDCLSRHDIGLKVAKAFNLDPSLIRRVPTTDLGLPAKRPRCSCLDVKKTEVETNTKMLSLEEGLEEMHRTEGKG
ncbi:MAG: sugar nucleotide-binding protein, partial [Euryarchaeota archaeon]|nr:sugar nucleotide-binding protein [Euryarchaeota archaeon]